MPERRGKTVLVIDDDAAIAKLVKLMLTGVVERVLVATDAAEGLAIARAERPEVILCDVQMPGMTGFEVRRQLATDATLAEVPFVFISAHSHVDAQLSGMRLGATAYLVKPIHRDTLIATVLHQLERQPSQPLAPLRSQSAEFPAAVPRLSGRFDIIPVSDLLQLIEASRRSGVLAIKGRSISGEMVFNRGRLLTARTNHWTGEDAALRLLWLKEGQFHFEKRDVSVAEAEPFGWTISRLLLDAAWLHDELARLGSTAPGVNDPVAIEDAMKFEELFPERAKWAPLLSSGTVLRASELAAQIGTSTYRCRALLGLAVERGAIRVLQPN